MIADDERAREAKERLLKELKERDAQRMADARADVAAYKARFDAEEAERQAAKDEARRTKAEALKIEERRVRATAGFLLTKLLGRRG